MPRALLLVALAPFAVACTPVASARLIASDTVVYDVSFPNAAHHEADISISYGNLPAGTLELRMSRASPGRYALHEFAKNVYSVRAVDGNGEPLRITRPNPYQWNVDGHSGTVRVSYTWFADHADGTYSGVDLTHAHLNAPATFLRARGTEERPIRVALRPPTGVEWKVATQLAPTSSLFGLTAPNLYYFLDSPIEASDFDSEDRSARVH